MTTLYTNGAFITLTPAQFIGYTSIRYSDAQPGEPVALGFSASGTVDFSARLGSVSAEVDGWTGNDGIIAGGGNDSLWGNSGNDTLTGQAGDDLLCGDWDNAKAIGDDWIYGGEGNDLLVGGSGANQLYGGNGDDTFLLTDAVAAKDGFSGGAGNDFVFATDYFGRGLTSIAINHLDLGAASGIEGFVLGDTGLNLTGTEGDDLIDLSGVAGWTRLAGGSYGQGLRFDLLGGRDSYKGSTNGDDVTVQDGNDTISLGDGDDFLSIIGLDPGGDRLTAGNGIDTLQFRGDLATDTLDHVRVASLVLDALAGFETLHVVGGVVLDGTDGNDKFDLSAITTPYYLDRINLGAGNDSYVGGAISDRVEGGAGDDTFYGGAGNDIYYLGGKATAAESLFGGADIDTITFTGGASAATGAPVFERLVFSAAQSFELVRSEKDADGVATVVLGTAAANLFDLSAISYAGQPSQTEIAASFDLGAGDDTYLGGGFSQSVMGGDGNDTLTGGINNDRLDGGSGADWMDGGAGSDIYVVDSVNDVIVEAGLVVNQGIDTVETSLSRYTLARNIEALVATGLADFNGTGNGAGNRMTGGAGNDVLTGLGGNDTLMGGLGADSLDGGTGTGKLYGEDGDDRLVTWEGDDLLYGGAGGDVLSSTTGKDTMHGDAGNDTLISGDGNDRLFGDDGNDRLDGGTGNDRLDGGTGADRLIGGLGDDIYYSDGQDRIVEAADGGLDLAYATGGNLSLDPGVEDGVILTLGGAHLDGNGLANHLTGAGGADTIAGLGGNDTLTGGSGANRLEGGTGDDLYRVTSARDILVEAANQGFDMVESRLSHFTLAANVEAFTHLGLNRTTVNGNAQDNVFTGTVAAETYYGFAGNDVFYTIGTNSSIGGDQLYGGKGDDTYYIQPGAWGPINIVEAAGGGNDTVVVCGGFSCPDNVETLKTFGAGYGNAQNNIIIGSDGENTLGGLAGADTLTGGLGKDYFAFGEHDAVDTITDFETGVDLINLNSNVFQGLDPADQLHSIRADEFKEISAGQVDASDRILFNKLTGALYWDIDGSGGAAAVQFAVLEGGATLTSGDFYIRWW